jgi:hypothetical protein
MNGFRGWMRQFFAKLAFGLRRFMEGRYGMDKLNMVMLWTGVIASLLSTLIPVPPFNLILWGVSYVLMFVSIFRILSRNTYKRYQENRKFLQFFDRLEDRDHRYYDCPKCRQMVRVPRGKGKISITCPRCREKFVKKT